MDTNEYLKTAGLNMIQIESIKGIAAASGLKSVMEGPGGMLFGRKKPVLKGNALTKTANLVRQNALTAKERAAREAKERAEQAKMRSKCIVCQRHFNEYESCFPIDDELIHKNSDGLGGILFVKADRHDLDDNIDPSTANDKKPRYYYCPDCAKEHMEKERDIAARKGFVCPVCQLEVPDSECVVYHGDHVHPDCLDRAVEAYHAMGIDGTRMGSATGISVIDPKSKIINDENLGEFDDSVDFEEDIIDDSADPTAPINTSQYAEDSSGIDHDNVIHNAKKNRMNSLRNMSSEEYELIKDTFYKINKALGAYGDDDYSIGNDEYFGTADKKGVGADNLGSDMLKLINNIPVENITPDLAESLEACLAISSLPKDVVTVITDKLKEYNDMKTTKVNDDANIADLFGGAGLSAMSSARQRVNDLKMKALKRIREKRTIEGNNEFLKDIGFDPDEDSKLPDVDELSYDDDIRDVEEQD